MHPSSLPPRPSHPGGHGGRASCWCCPGRVAQGQPAFTVRPAPAQGWDAGRPIVASGLTPRAKGVSGKVRGEKEGGATLTQDNCALQVFGLGIELAFARFTLMILLTMAGMAIFLVPA
jgi:hypothetical protein